MRGSSTSSVRWRLRAMTTLGAVALAGLAIVLVLGGHLPGRSGYDGSPVAGAWERVADTGSYRFRGEIEQTRAPGQGVLNAGRETRVDRMQLEGRADLTRSDVTLDVWSQGDSLSTTDADLSLRVQDGVSSRSLRGGPWQVTGAPGEAGAVLGPDGNPMTFLLAARDVSAVDTAVRGGRLVTRYAFTVDGPTMGKVVAEHLADRMRKNGTPAAAVTVPSEYRDLSGHGELWVGADGLPVRQVLDLVIPDRSGESVTASMHIDFSGFGYAGRPWGLLTALGPVAPWLALLAALSLGGLLMVLAARRGGRSVRRAVVVVVSAALVTTTLVGAAGAAEPPAGGTADIAAAGATAAGADAMAAARAALGSASATADPHRSALEVTGSTSNAGQSPSAGAPAAIAPSTAVESDTGVDTDADGLSDFIENRIGTNPAEADSDADGLSDLVEVTGAPVSGGGIVWFTDPKVMDTNSDGNGDGAEWDRNGDGLADDTDGDGMADVFDGDNDGDGVPDHKDVSPYAAGATYSNQQPLALRIDGLSTDRRLPTAVDIQLRPSDPSQLRLALSPLDWPSDRKGQIRDVDNSNDDLMLVPMLEITIPDASFVLPTDEQLHTYGITVTAADGSGARVAYVPLSLVSDEHSGSRVGFSGRMLYLSQPWGTTQTVRLVWVVQVDNDLVCDPHATPPQAGCGADGYIRNQRQAVHRYYDDWQLTGLRASESHGATAALLNADPTLDTRGRDHGMTWLLADVLSQRFLTAMPDGTGGFGYAVTPQNMADRFDRVRNGGGAAGPYGLPNVFRVRSADYVTLDEAIADVSATVTPVVLGGYGWSGADSTRPLLLTAYTDDARSLGLDELGSRYVVSGAGGALTLDLRPSAATAVPIDTIGGFKATEYCGGTGQTPVWKACTAEESFSRLEAQAGSVLLDPTDPSRTVSSLDPATAEAENVFMYTYASAMLNGTSAVLARDFGPGLGKVIVSQFDFDSDSALIARIYATWDKFSTYLGPGMALVKFVANQYMLRVLVSTGQLSAGVAAQGTLSQIAAFLRQLTTTKWGIFAFGVGLVVTLAALAVAAYFYAKGNPAAVLTVKVLAVVLPALMNIAAPLYTVASLKAFAAAGGVVAGGTNLSSLASQTMGLSNGAAIFGLVLSLGITWALFIAAVAGSGMPWFGAAFNRALATSIASSILAVMMFALALSGVGLIVVGIVALIDGIFLLVCDLADGGDVLRTNFTDGNCFTVSGAVTKIITTFLYAYELMVDTAASNLVDTGTPSITLADPDRSYSAGNKLHVSLPVTTNLAHLDPSMASFLVGPYLWLYDKASLRSSTFKYSLTEPDPETLVAERGEMSGSWAEPVFHHNFIATPFYATQYAQTVQAPPIPLAVAGLDQEFSLNFNLALAVPAVECWNSALVTWIVGGLLAPVPVCYRRSFSDASTTRFDPLYFDVMPATLHGFAAVAARSGGKLALAWDNRFGALADADGDGALALGAGGLDPDDNSADLDADGLTDGFELQQREAGMAMSPSLWDTDLDGLTDAQELQYGTDPARADTDNDGLSDGQEVRHPQYAQSAGGPAWDGTFSGGWQISVEGRWAPASPIVSSRVINVSSDPTRADGDSDGVTDAAERQLAQSAAPADRLDQAGRPYHPSDPNVAPLAVYVNSDDPDGYVRPDQALTVQTSAVANRAVEPGVLQIGLPASFGPSPAPAGLAFDPATFVTTQTASSETRTTVPKIGSGAVTVSADARARLVSLPAQPVEWTISDETPIAGNKAYGGVSVTPRQADRAGSYLLSDGSSSASAAKGAGDVRAVPLPDGTRPVLDRDTEPVAPSRTDYAFLRGDDLPRAACTTDGSCFTVWEHYDNCSAITLNWLRVIDQQEPGSSGIEPGVYLRRQNQNDLLWFPQNNGGNDMGDGTQRGPNASGFPTAVATYCGAANLTVLEIDGNAVTLDNFEQFQYTTASGSAVNQSQGNYFGFDEQTVLAGRTLDFTNADYRDNQTRTTSRCHWSLYPNTYCNRVQVNVSIAPRPHDRVAGSITNASGAVSTAQFQMTPASPQWPADAEDRNPDVASNGREFAVVSERFRRSGSNQERWVVLTRYSAAGRFVAERTLWHRPLGAAGEADTTVEWVDGSWRVTLRDQSASATLTVFDVDADLGASKSSSFVTSASGWFRRDSFSLAYDPPSGRSLLAYESNAGGIVASVYNRGASTPAATATLFATGSRPEAAANPLTRGWLVTAQNAGSLWAASTGPLLESPANKQVPKSSQSGAVDAGSVACPAWQSLPVADLRFEELPGATTFVDASAWAHNATTTAAAAPAAGYAGAPGAPASDFAVGFDGTGDRLQLANPVGNELSLTFWYRATTARTGQAFALRGGGGNGYALEISSTGAVSWVSNGSRASAASSRLADGAWHFVAATRSAAGALKVSVDATGVASLATSHAPSSGGELRIEGGAGVSLVDHLRVFATGLGDVAVAELYNRTDQQVCVTAATIDVPSGTALYPWNRHQFVTADTRGGQITQSAQLRLTVDDDLPTAAVLVGDAAVAGSAGAPVAHKVGGTAHDATSPVIKVEVSVNNGPWQLADGANSWTYDVAVTNGSYAIRSRATDAVGHVGPVSAPVVLVVDAVAPAVRLTAPSNRPVRPAADPTSGVPTVALSGTVSDNVAGVAPDGVEVRLALPADGATQFGWQPATVSGGNWAIDYAFSAAATDVTGSYRVLVRAVDRTGNRTADDAATGTLLLDDAAPEASLTPADLERPFLAAGSAIGGSVHDPGGAGVAAVEAAFRPIQEVSGGTGTPNWIPVTVSAAGQGGVDASWSLTAPVGLENFYQLDLRARDVLGNEKVLTNVWRGNVDTTAPRVTLTAVPTGIVRSGGTHVELAYRCAAVDLFLLAESFSCPGEATGPPSRTFDDDAVRRELFPDQALLTGLELQYAQWENAGSTVATMRACDAYGNCSSAQPAGAAAPVAPAAAALAAAAAAIVSPTYGQYVAASGTLAVAVAAEAAGSIKRLTLSVDGVQAAERTFAAGAVTSFEDFLPVAVSGERVHRLTFQVEGHAGAVSDAVPVDFFLDLAAPTVTLTTTTIAAPGTWGNGSDVVRLGGTVADGGVLVAVQIKVGVLPWAEAIVDTVTGTWRAATRIEDVDGDVLTVRVRAYDLAGRLTEITGSSQVDLAPGTPGFSRPDTLIDSGPSGTTASSSAIVTFHGVVGSGELGGTRCRVDDEPLQPCSSPWTVAGLAAGSHRVEVVAHDAAGYVDLTAARRSWAVSAGGPQAALTEKPADPTAAKDATFAFTGPKGATFRCSLDGGPYTPCRSPQAYRGLAEGTHRFRVTATVGSTTGTPLAYRWQVANDVPLVRSQVITVAADSPTGEPVTLSAVDSDPVDFHLVEQPRHGTLEGSAPNLRYVPFFGYSGPDSFSFVADDGQAVSGPATVDVTVRAAGFAVYADECVVVGDGVTVDVGGIGVNQAGSTACAEHAWELSVGQDVRMKDDTAIVVADSMRIQKGSTLVNVRYNDWDNKGTVRGTVVRGVTLPWRALPLSTAAAVGSTDVRIADSKTQRLEPGPYRTLEVGSNATLVLSGGVYSFGSWSLAKKAKIRFEAPTEIRIAGRVVAGEMVSVQPQGGVAGLDATDLVLEVAGTDGTGGAAPAFVMGKGGRLDAYVLVPSGTLQLGEAVDAAGSFLGRWVTVGRNAKLTTARR